MYVRGATLKDMALEMRVRIEQTSEGFPIEDNEMYAVTSVGVYLIE